MGLFDTFLRTPGPDAIDVTPAPGTLLAPTSGEIITLDQVPDPVFSRGMMGKGCGIKPSEGIVYAPADGRLTAVGGSNPHAFALLTDDGAALLVHVGIDTVAMRGDGFTVFADKGDHINAGNPILSFSLEKIEAAGLSDIVVMAVTNSDEFSNVELVVEGSVGAGTPVLTYS